MLLRVDSGIFADGRSLEFVAPSRGEDAGLGRDIATLDEADSVRLQRRLDELRNRVSLIESRGSP